MLAIGDETIKLGEARASPELEDQKLEEAKTELCFWEESLKI